MGQTLTDAMSYKVDWLAFTCKLNKINDYSITIRKILDYLGYDIDLFKECAGRYFYNSGITLGDYCNVFYNDPRKITTPNSHSSVNFQFTGTGCTDLGVRLQDIYESDDYEQNWIRLFKFLTENDYKITRVDLALDDFKGYNSFEKMEQKLKKGYYRSVKKTFAINRGSDQKQNITGLTIYVGTMPKGGAGSAGIYYLRMYKKLAEYQAKGQLPPEKARISGVWDRYEIQFTKKKAQDVVARIIENGGFSSVYLGALRGLVEFLEPTRNKNGNLYRNKARWKVSPWWENFLQHAEKVKIGSDDIRSVSFSDLLSWIRVAVVPSLKLLEEIGKKRKFNIYELIEHVDGVEFGKKQKRLYYDSLAIPNKTLEKYLKEFQGLENGK